MPRRRIQRLNEQLKRDISDIILREVRDPRIGVVTVTDVDVTPDLAFARVYVRPMGDDEEKAEALEGLKNAAPHIRHLLSQELTTRRVPELHFQEDETLERAMRIEEILHEVRPEGGWEDVDEDHEDPGGDTEGDEADG